MLLLWLLLLELLLGAVLAESLLVVTWLSPRLLLVQLAAVHPVSQG